MCFWPSIYCLCYFSPFIFAACLCRLCACSFTGVESSLAQLFVGGLCWEGQGPYSRHLALPASPGVSWECLCGLRCSSASGGGGDPLPLCSACFLLNAPLFTRHHLAAFACILRLAFLPTPSFDENGPHAFAFWFFLLLVHNSTQRKGKWWLTCPIIKPAGYTGTQSPPPNSAECLRSAVRLHHVIKRRKWCSQCTAPWLRAMAELATCSLLLGEKTKESEVMWQCRIWSQCWRVSWPHSIQ